METVFFDFAHDVEEETLDGKVQVLVLEEHAGDKAEVFAVNVLESAVDFEESYLVVLVVLAAIDFHAGRVSNSTLTRMTKKLLLL